MIVITLWLAGDACVLSTDLEEQIMDAYLVSIMGLKHSYHLIRIFENNTDKLCDWLLLGQCDCFFRIMKIIQIN